MDYRIDLEAFGGPMDLLLYLVKKNEVDIYDIPIADILDQFLEYMKLLTHLDVDGVGEFLVMASTLMEIKSRMLLPHAEDADLLEDEDDPRTELVRQLLDYKRFKEISEELDEQRKEQARRFPRGASGEYAADGDEEPRFTLGELTLWDLCAAYSKILQEIEFNQSREVILDDTPVEEHMNRIISHLKSVQRAEFRSLVPMNADRGTLIGIFVALLELVREKEIRVFQQEDFGEIQVSIRDDPPADSPRFQEFVEGERPGA